MNGTNLTTNGHATTSSNTTNGKSANGSNIKPIIRKPLGGITVKTVKRTSAAVRPALPNSHSAPSTSTDLKRMHNALPEETRRRIEEARLEKERKKRKEEDEIRQRKAYENRAAKREHSTPKKKKVKRQVSDDESDDDLFSGNSTPKNGKSSKRGASADESS